MRVVVVGAGMAGLAAAQELTRCGAAVTVVEARTRIGGRTWTGHDVAPHPVEYGAEFVHGDRVVTWQLIERLGLRTVAWRKTDDSLIRLEDGRLTTMAEARSVDPRFDLTRSWALPRVAALPTEDWRSYLTRIGFDCDQLRYVQRSFANASGEAMRFLSATAMLDQIRDRGAESGFGDYRILDGYGALVDALSLGLELRLACPVERLDWGRGGVRAHLPGGEVLAADAAVLTAPVGVLQAGTLHFAPELPDAKRRALAGIRMGPVIKLIFRFAEAPAPDGIVALYSAGNPPMWWSPSAGHPGPARVWTGFVSGGWAHDLLELGSDGALHAALATLRRELGRPRLEPEAARLIDWPGDPWARGGYSFVLPGHDGAREGLARPTPPLFWAGEATEPEHRAATVHGAYLSGLRAAAEVMHLLETRPRRRPLPRSPDHADGDRPR